MDPIAPVTINENNIRDIEAYAAGMERDEILHIFYTTYEALSPRERRIFDASFARGRALAQNRAVNCLFNQMSGKEGVKGALAYLIRFSKEWPNVEDEGVKSGNHVFKVLMPR